MTKKEIKKLADDLSKIPYNITGDNKKNWQDISNEIAKHPDLVDRLISTNADELRDKGFIAFALTYGLMTQSFIKS